MSRTVIAGAILLAAVTLAAGAEIAFAGINLEGAPSFDREFDRQLRENLLSTPGISMADYESTRMLDRKINFAAYPAMSRALVERMIDYVPDTTVLVWGRVRDYSVRTGRKNLLWASAYGTLTITLNIYSLRFDKYAFSGDITCRTELSKGLIWFYPVEKLVHITATEKADMNSSLAAMAAARAASMIGAVVRSEITKVEAIEGAKRYEDPSVKRVFEHPSMQAPAVDTLRKATPPDDTAAPASDTTASKNGALDQSDSANAAQDSAATARPANKNTKKTK